MSELDAHDLEEYFRLYEAYEKTEEPSLIEETDKRLSQYKDRFHKHASEVLLLLEEGKRHFADKYKSPYRDLLFDLEMHAKTMEEIQKTHTFDSQQDMWVPKEK
jgi:hypothetical protein